MKLITKEAFNLAETLPFVVREILKEKRAFLAGGFPLFMVKPEATATDIDLFTTYDKLDGVIQSLKWDGYVLEAQSRFAYTFRGMTGLPIQVIPVEGLDLKGSVLPLLLTFDLQPSQIAYNEITDEIEMTPGAESGIAGMYVELGKVKFPLLVMQRLLKYQEKGFNVKNAANRLLKEVAKTGYSKLRAEEYELSIGAVGTLEIENAKKTIPWDAPIF